MFPLYAFCCCLNSTWFINNHDEKTTSQLVLSTQHVADWGKYEIKGTLQYIQKHIHACDCCALSPMGKLIKLGCKPKSLTKQGAPKESDSRSDLHLPKRDAISDTAQHSSLIGRGPHGPAKGVP